MPSWRILASLLGLPSQYFVLEEASLHDDTSKHDKQQGASHEVAELDSSFHNLLKS